MSIGAAAEALQILIAGVRADAHPVLLGQRDRVTHHDRVAGVEAAGDVGRRDQRHERRVVAQAPEPERFTHVAVDLGGHRAGAGAGASAAAPSRASWRAAEKNAVPVAHAAQIAWCPAVGSRSISWAT